MNQENLNYLKENLKYMGFGDKLNDKLEHNINQGFPDFVLKMESEFNKSKLESALHFSRSKETDMYFFNRHDAVLKNDVGTLEQTFYVNKGHGVTLKEAFNLLEGRAVYKELTPKEGERYHAWVQLDFKQKEENGNYKTKQFHENYGYNLAETLGKFPIKELMDETKNERLISSLQKGNLQSVTISMEGKDQQFFIQANPQYKTLTIYDNGATRPLSNEQKVELMTPEARQKLNGKDVSTEVEKGAQEIKQGGKGKKEKTGQKHDDSLLPKKGTSENKGMAIS
jgi:hypothetical protein